MAEEAGEIVPFSTGKWAYDVFLNFRGVDTRDGFTKTLYKSLIDRGIRTFFDDDELSRGKEIKSSLLRAIEESMIGIVIFSANYASSAYCLDELVHILDCCKGHDRLVLPVFVDVDPSHVRYQLGTYGDAMAKHEQQHRVDQAKLQRWKEALADAADLSGWHIQQGSKAEFTFVRKIIGEVSRKINRSPLHNIGNHLVGLESPVREVIKLLKLDMHQLTTMVGIHGPPGRGKTTLAQAVYSSISGQFEAICFLSDIRQKSRELGLVRLQEMLLSDIVGENIKFTDASEIIPTIKRRIRGKKVLLILDDISHDEQLESLLGPYNWFGSGSRVIITTRTQLCLDCHGVVKQYELKLLHEEEALELFCWKAFESRDVDPIYMELSKLIVRYTHGVPLVLELVGSNLFGKPISEWIDIFNIVSCGDVSKSILTVRVLQKISYESWDDDVKTIFLDIACCFNGYKLDYLTDLLLNARGFSPKYALQVLVSKSYIKIDDGVVRMQNSVQEIGRLIVQHESTESTTMPGKRSRLWYYEDILDVLKNNTGGPAVEIMKIDLPKDKQVLWDGNGFKNMENLKILEIINARFSEVPKIFPNSLKVLNWNGYFGGANQ